ncbi:hypothetical protein FDI24_gp122 [Acidovorax phage ACP17]|uniref:Uncharacterized protein n=1 Tax=Acidovorax phage ACP17 TaxID=2010329 RepID=A0A218M2X8_9CAUD|nr:hypothetical protein FDI24_gp122 [Acidovorax phage ACP17]ASD50402.1 hypothetical protein [Acidovorax phage ACP17]
MRTLFCDGGLGVDEVIAKAVETSVGHVYLNSNHSFLAYGEDKISQLLMRGYAVTYEYGNQGGLHPEPFPIEHPNLVHLRSVVVTKVRRGVGHYLKIDDLGFQNTNPGVWTFKPGNYAGFTPWSAYLKDDIVE